jgi:hypothetical protein
VEQIRKGMVVHSSDGERLGKEQRPVSASVRREEVEVDEERDGESPRRPVTEPDDLDR